MYIVLTTYKVAKEKQMENNSLIESSSFLSIVAFCKNFPNYRL